MSALPFRFDWRETLTQTSNCSVHVQENAGKPEGLPPSQGGKYVGFGSGGSAPSASGGRRAGGHAAGGPGLDDVSHVLSKGFTQACTVAGARQWLHLSPASLHAVHLALTCAVMPHAPCWPWRAPSLHACHCMAPFPCHRCHRQSTLEPLHQ